jgi:mediator of RNA polymerase II transcription subunit 12
MPRRKQQGMRSRVNQDNSQYSIEWTCTLTSYTRKLLSEITLPSPPRQGLNIRQSFKNTFADPETSEQWTRKCSYMYANFFRHQFPEY